MVNQCDLGVCYSCKAFEGVISGSPSSQKKYLKLLIHTFYEHYHELQTYRIAEKLDFISKLQHGERIRKDERERRGCEDDIKLVVTTATFTAVAIGFCYLMKINLTR
jgi:hypothetical protein